ncbi:MAG TPA: hypothetical protein PLL14_02710 [Accumulibacter sp.]|nr:hypothetical protein [Accumulibacter sp.]
MLVHLRFGPLEILQRWASGEVRLLALEDFLCCFCVAQFHLVVEAGLDLLGRPRSLRSNPQALLVSCLRRQFAAFVDILEVRDDVLLAALEQRGALRLRQPERFVVQPHVDLDAAVIGSMDQKLALPWRVRVGNQLGHDDPAFTSARLPEN